MDSECIVYTGGCLAGGLWIEKIPQNVQTHLCRKNGGIFCVPRPLYACAVVEPAGNFTFTNRKPKWEKTVDLDICIYSIELLYGFHRRQLWRAKKVFSVLRPHTLYSEMQTLPSHQKQTLQLAHWLLCDTIEWRVQKRPLVMGKRFHHWYGAQFLDQKNTTQMIVCKCIYSKLS